MRPSHILGQGSMLEPALLCSACWDRPAFVPDRGNSRSRREQVQHVRSSSRRSEKHREVLSTLRSQQAARQVRHSAAAAGESDVSTSNPVPGGREFFSWIVDLPWNRLGVWLVVAWFVYQLKDFFGVSGCAALLHVRSVLAPSMQRCTWHYTKGQPVISMLLPAIMCISSVLG